MIGIDDENPGLKIVEFGFGSVGICPTNTPEGLANGVLLYDKKPDPIGTLIPEHANKDVRSFDSSVLLLFHGVAGLDILLEDLQEVRRAILAGESIDPDYRGRRS